MCNCQERVHTRWCSEFGAVQQVNQGARMNAHRSLAVAEPLSPAEPLELAAIADPMVRFEGASKVYPAYRDKPSVHALTNIDIAIPRGSITGVIGRSGAGKSSLVRL